MNDLYEISHTKTLISLEKPVARMCTMPLHQLPEGKRAQRVAETNSPGQFLL